MFTSVFSFVRSNAGVSFTLVGVQVVTLIVGLLLRAHLKIPRVAPYSDHERIGHVLGLEDAVIDIQA